MHTIEDALIASLITIGTNILLTTLYAIVILVAFRRIPVLRRLVFPFAEEMTIAARLLRQEMKNSKTVTDLPSQVTLMSILRTLGWVNGATVLGLFILLAAVVSS